MSKHDDDAVSKDRINKVSKDCNEIVLSNSCKGLNHNSEAETNKNFDAKEQSIYVLEQLDALNCSNVLLHDRVEKLEEKENKLHKKTKELKRNLSRVHAKSKEKRRNESRRKVHMLKSQEGRM